jgi:uncharacterized protein (DUF302 family)
MEPHLEGTHKAAWRDRLAGVAASPASQRACLTAVLCLTLVSGPGTARSQGEGGLMAATRDSGIITKPSHHPVDQTVERLKGLLEAKGITLFALVDHSGEAAKIGLNMPPTKLLIFGNPKAGTPLMLAAPSVALDLPLKILIWQDSGGNVWLSYNSPAYLKERHGLPQELVGTLGVVDVLAAAAGA